MTDSIGVRVRRSTSNDWKQIRDFLQRNWRENHPICEQWLCDWQFRGFGTADQEISSILLTHDDELIGFRGVIPVLFQVPTENDKMKVIEGGEYSMWMVREDFRGKRLGLMMHQETERMMQSIVTLGSNPTTSAPIYRKSGWSLLDSMHRYVTPLDASGYHGLLIEKSDINAIKEWAQIWQKDGRTVRPEEPDVKAIAALWKERTFPLRIFSLYRNAEFWRWRYLDSPGFQYLFFGNASHSGIIVARIEFIVSEDYPEMHGRKMLRLIEVLPKSSRAWEGGLDGDLVDLVQGVVRWSISQGCVAADFHCTTPRFEKNFIDAGFQEQDYEIDGDVCGIAPLLQPLEFRKQPINVGFRIDVPGIGPIRPGYEDTYIVKSDSDQDRPNLIGYERLV